MPGLGTAPDESGLKSPSGGAVHSPGIYARAKVGVAPGFLPFSLFSRSGGGRWEKRAGVMRGLRAGAIGRKVSAYAPLEPPPPHLEQHQRRGHGGVERLDSRFHGNGEAQAGAGEEGRREARPFGPDGENEGA